MNTYAYVANTTIKIGLLLIVVSLLSSLLTDTSGMTIFIPLFLGVPIAIFGWIGRHESRTYWAMIITTSLAVLGAIGATNIIANIFTNSTNIALVLARGSMFLLCLLLTNIGGIWLIQNRP
ncbi:MAG: hypothetical protein AAF902_11370 [Chloroflexota bacterium]